MKERGSLPVPLTLPICAISLLIICIIPLIDCTFSFLVPVVPSTYIHHLVVIVCQVLVVVIIVALFSCPGSDLICTKDYSNINRIAEHDHLMDENWHKWKERMRQVFYNCDITGYVTGDIECPNEAIDPVGTWNWDPGHNESLCTMLVPCK